ncbi:patatin-like phospholipase family protein [Tundrisphaera lichenicola]|uniref:patatin-like phospholipase family protein n=1 Tax=Tundrisphaera lichenicola TaxID=2029860 RepID=UPI003EB96714
MPFSEVLRDELKLIAARREVVSGLFDAQSASLGRPLPDIDDRTLESHGLRVADIGPEGRTDEDSLAKQARLTALRGHVTGLSFSGGGIRSGTFAVGFLQGLAALGLLRRIDYLSTVSGGGYAGAWLAAWLKREGGDPVNVERQLSPSRVTQAQAYREHLVRDEVVDEEPQPLRHLRSYSSFMFPRPGILSADTWTVIMIWVRNVSINLLMLLPMAMLLVVAARMTVHAFVRFNPVGYDPGFFGGWDWWISLVGLVVGAALMFRALTVNARELREVRLRYVRPDDTIGAVPPVEREVVMKRVRDGVIIPGSIAALLLTINLRPLVWGIGERVEMIRSTSDVSAASTFGSVILGALQANLGVLGMTNFVLTALVLGGVLGLGAAGNATRIATSRVRTISTLALMATWLAFFLMVGHLLIRFFGSGEIPVLGWLGGLPDGLPLALFAVALVIELVALGRRGRRYVLAASVAGATGGVLLVLLEAFLKDLAGSGRPGMMATFGPPLTLLIAVAALIVQAALLGRVVGEAEREWWARISARLTLVALFWIVGMATVIYLPGVFLASGTITRSLIASGWIVTAAAGVFSGQLKPARQQGDPALRLTQIASLAAQVFLIGLLGVVALVGSMIVNRPGLFTLRGDNLGPFESYLEGVKGTAPLSLVLLGLGSLVLYLLARELIDVNLFSLNAMYTNRLARCYLGASRPMSSWARRWGGKHDPRVPAGAPSLSRPSENLPIRADNPITGFDPSDDLDLGHLRIGRAEGQGGVYYGPHLLINTTLNLVGSDDMATRDRKGESFTLSPLYCGSKGVGFARYEGEVTRSDDFQHPNLTLGRAISISGAAVDPNMSFYQSAPLTALLTLFNARLGYWIEKPRRDGWGATSPRFSDLWLDEFFGRTDGKGKYLHLSDGGHFENLGAYELIRRRCRYVIVVDAAEDGDASDDNLASLIRLCRIDFGIRIKIDTAPLKSEGPERLSRSHVVIGQIHYDDVDRGELPGVLVYVKSSMTGDEPPDLQKYARRDDRFPHQPTDLRQSFNEEQFECYRCLGDHIARKIFEDPTNRVVEDLRVEARENGIDETEILKLGHRKYVPRLFSAIQDRWSEPPDDRSGQLAEVSAAWLSIQRDLSRQPELADLSRDLYPILPEIIASSPADRAARAHAEIHTVSRILQVMELTWRSLSLQQNSSLSINRGWMNTFRRCTGTASFRRLWPVLRPEFSSEFVRFCEQQLNLTTAIPQAVRLEVASTGNPPIASDFGEHGEALRLLDLEFEREWPADHRAGRGLLDLISRAKDLKLRNLPIWVIYQGPSGTAMAGDSPQRFPCGIILAAPFLDHPQPSPDDEGVPVELLVWVRRPYRSIGLASHCLTRKLVNGLRDEIQEALGLDGPSALWARYPLPNPVDNDLEHASWLVFLARYDFKPKYWKSSEGAEPWSCSLLHLD